MLILQLLNHLVKLTIGRDLSVKLGDHVICRHFVLAVHLRGRISADHHLIERNRPSDADLAMRRLKGELVHDLGLGRGLHTANFARPI